MTSATAETVSDPRRWRALAVLGLIQFMLILDVTVVNVALPSIQDSLHMSEGGLAWVVEAYVLAAGGLLLLGGRLADLLAVAPCSWRAWCCSASRRPAAASRRTAS